MYRGVPLFNPAANSPTQRPPVWYSRLSDSELNKLEEQLNNKLSTLEQSLFESLKDKIIDQIQDCPVEFVDYLRQENYSIVSKRISPLTAETEQLGRALSRELGKIGWTEQEFFEKMEKYHEKE